MHFDRQTFRPRPLDQSPGMNSANVQVAHRPPNSVNRANVSTLRPDRYFLKLFFTRKDEKKV